MGWHWLLLLALAGEALTVSRRSVCVTPVVGGLATVAGPALAFDGQGSSAYAGRTPSSVAQLKKSYQDRVAADVRGAARRDDDTGCMASTCAAFGA